MDNLEHNLALIRKNRRYCLFHNKKTLIKKLYSENFDGETLNLKNPRSFNQKLSCRKLSRDPLLRLCADKNSVRDYVAQKIGEEYLILQYFCKKHIRPEDLKDLPDSFVLKTTSGSGANLIIKDKAKVNLAEICRTMNSYTKIKYGYLWGEFFYNKIKNQVVAEKLLTKDEVYDYKIHCFRDNSGRLRQILEILWGPKSDRHKSMYDPEWRPLSYSFSLPPDGKAFKKPEQLGRLLELSAKLSEDFSYVRVDFYIIDKKIYFGELTFTPAAGFGKFSPSRYDETWGDWIGGDLK